MSCANPGRVGLLLAMGLLAACAPAEGDSGAAAAWVEPGLVGAELEPGVVLIVEMEPQLDPFDLPAVGVARSFRRLPMAVVTVEGADAVEVLAATPGVRRIWAEPVEEPFLTESLGVIAQPAAEVLGVDGDGVSVAVLDSGVDYSRAAFGGCAAAGAPGCVVALARNMGAGLSPGSHGTNVAGIVHGVAPAASILDYDLGESSFSGSGILAAIDEVIDRKDEFNTVAMNMSFGSGANTASCNSTSYLATPIATARAAGILSAVASGNSASATEIAAPACVDEAVAVGATWDLTTSSTYTFSNCVDRNITVDKVTCFSNSNSMVDVLAPGALITAAGVSMTGTSQATPHVAGALAALWGAMPGESADTVVALLLNSGDAVTDTRNGLSFPRINLGEAASRVEGDHLPPTGSVVINEGSAATRLLTASLSLAATDDSTVTEVCVDTDTVCTNWQSFAATRSVTLSSSDGVKTVYAWFGDALGNRSRSPVTDTIRLDRTKPANGSVVATAAVGAVGLSWSGFRDGGSGMAAYKIAYATGDAAPTTCNGGTSLGTTTSTSFSHTGLNPGLTYRYRVCGIDAAGNMGSGVTAAKKPLPESTIPTVSIAINAGADYTRSRAVTVSVDAHDDLGLSQICLSNSTTCPAWLTYATTKSWTLSSSTDPMVVYGWVKDTSGNVSAMATDSIRLDATRPADGTLAAVAGTGEVTLAWSDFSDGGAGLASYLVVYRTGGAPDAYCASGTTAYAGTDTAYVHTGRTNGTTVYYRVCAVDAVGNISAGATASARPLLEFSPPTGTVSINGGATYTRSLGVSLALAATDASAVTGMCVSNSSTCTSFVSPVSTKSWTLSSSGAATQTVNVWWKDEHGNVMSTPATDSIEVDATKPSDGTVSASAGSGSIDLSWSGFSDSQSGVVSYVAVRAVGSTAPSSCSVGTATYAGAATSTTVSSLARGTYSLRVCAVDAVGNTSAGATTRVTVP